MAWAEKLPSGRYRGLYRDASGKKRSVGETFTHKARAERAAAALEGKARRSMRGDPDAYRRPWGEWCDDWWPTRSVESSTLINDESRRRTHLDARWGDVPVGSIRRHDVKEWAAAMRRRGVGASTVQRAVHLLSASLNAAVDAEIIESNPAARVTLPKGGQAMERFLTREEVAAVVDEMPTTLDQTIVYFLAYTGLRWGEMAGLHAGRLDLERGRVRVVETFNEKAGSIKAYPKGRSLRDVPIDDWLAARLAELPVAKSCGLEHVEGRCRGGLVLTSERGTVLRHTNWSDRVWHPALDRSGIGHARLHDLRHTFASWLIQSGMPLAEVGRLMGHASPSTTQKYAHLADTPTSAMMTALGDPTKVRLAAPSLPQSAVAANG
jgi:integrase